MHKAKVCTLLLQSKRFCLWLERHSMHLGLTGLGKERHVHHLHAKRTVLASMVGAGPRREQSSWVYSRAE